MDELTLLRELDADTPPPAPRAVYDARMRLRYELTAAGAWLEAAARDAAAEAGVPGAVPRDDQYLYSAE